jgi:tetratricopeptide (TPR) repeat protein
MINALNISAPQMRPTGTYAAHHKPIKALIAKGAFKEALADLLQLRRHLPLDVMMLIDMANCYWGLHDSDAAIQLVEVAIEIAPDVAMLRVKLGGMQVSIGAQDTAISNFEHALKLDPKSVSALSNLNRVAPFARNSQRTRMLKRLAQSKTASRRERAIASNTLGYIEDRADRTSAAFQHFTRSNQLNEGEFNPIPFANLVNDLTQKLKKPLNLGPLDTHGGPRLIFVCGMPRSGTTLVENILMRHSQVDSIAESPLLQKTLAFARQHLETRNDCDWIDTLTPALAQDLRVGLHRAISARFPNGPPPVVIDKLPLNCLEIGFAKTILPDARFIYMSRHPLDVGLSNFFTNFGTRHTYSQSLPNIAKMIKFVDDAAGHYEKTLPDVRRQSYRALVESPEAQIRAILNATDLPWEGACLSPDKSTGIVKTASLTQVRKPIHAGALQKWRRYETALQPLVQALSPDWITQWETRDQRQ